MKKRVLLWSAVTASALLFAGCCCNAGSKKCCCKKACNSGKHWHKVQCSKANCNAPDEVETVTIEAIGVIPATAPAPAADQTPATHSAPAATPAATAAQ